MGAVAPVWGRKSWFSPVGPSPPGKRQILRVEGWMGWGLGWTHGGQSLVLRRPPSTP